jgi:hypothetical protein
VRNTAPLPVPPHANWQIGSLTTGSTKPVKTGTVHPVVNKDNGLVVDKSSLHKISFEPLNCSFGIVRTTEVDNKKAVNFKDIAHRQWVTTGADVTIVVAVRTPGCAACRENALHISNWASSLNASNASRPKVSLTGIVKESGTPETDEAVLNFYSDYFRFPLYRDTPWKLFRAMGGRKISFWAVASRWYSLQKRFKSKNIESKPCGEIWMLGGLLVLDNRGEVRHVMHEKYGDVFDTEVLESVVKQIRQEQSQAKKKTNKSISTTSSTVSDRSDF